MNTGLSLPSSADVALEYGAPNTAENDGDDCDRSAANMGFSGPLVTAAPCD